MIRYIHAVVSEEDFGKIARFKNRKETWPAYMLRLVDMVDKYVPETEDIPTQDNTVAHNNT